MIKLPTPPAPISFEELRAMRQPEAERILIDKFPPILAGGASLPFYFSGNAGLGKTWHGLNLVRDLLVSRGWIAETLPPGLTGEGFKQLLYSWILSPGRRVIPCDESHETFTDSFWREFKLLINDNCEAIEFEAKDKEGKPVTAVFRPENHLFMFASNFSLEIKGQQKGAVSSRTIPVPFAPYCPTDKAAIWHYKANKAGLKTSPESAAMGIRCVVSNGREIAKQITALSELFSGTGSVLDPSTEYGMQCALFRCRYNADGLTRDHITILEYCGTKGRQVNEIERCACQGTSPLEALGHLIGMGFIYTPANGRKAITANAVSYLANLNKFKATYADEIAVAELPAPEWQKAVIAGMPKEEKPAPIVKVKAKKPAPAKLPAAKRKTA